MKIECATHSKGIRLNRLLTALGLCLLLGACAGRTKDCAALAGPGWKALASPPPDSAELLTRANLPSDSELVWLAQGPDKVMLCDHSNSLVTPGCGASTAYQFERENGKWVSRGVLLDICKQ